VSSYLFVHKEVAEHSEKYADEFEEFSIYYAIAWDNAVESRVSAARKEVDTLKRELDHYEKKVESLRHQKNQILSKGRSFDDETYDKLGRNERKLIRSKKKYVNYVKSMSNILKEVTERSWRDLHPLLLKLARFDSRTSAEEAQRMSSLKQVLKQLKSIAIEHGGLKADDRMKELAGMQPTAAPETRETLENTKESLVKKSGHQDIHHFPEDERDERDEDIETFLTKRYPQVRSPLESMRAGSNMLDESLILKESESILRKLKLDEVGSMNENNPVAVEESPENSHHEDQREEVDNGGRKGRWVRSFKLAKLAVMCHTTKKPSDMDEESKEDVINPNSDSACSYSMVGSERCNL